MNIPDNAITATIHATDKNQPVYTIPSLHDHPKTDFPTGTTFVVLARDISSEWLEGVVISDKKIVHGWILSSATRNLMAHGEMIHPRRLPLSDYAYNTPEDVYRASRLQKHSRGVAGIRVYGQFLLVFTLICTMIGGVAGVLFIQEASDLGSKLVTGAELGAVIGFGIGWILAFIPMARDTKFQVADVYYKLLVTIYRKKRRDVTVTPLISQADLDKAVSKATEHTK